MANSERRNNAKRCEFGVLPATRRMRSVASLAFSKTGVYSELGERNNAKRCEIETLCPIPFPQPGTLVNLFYN